MWHRVTESLRVMIGGSPPFMPWAKTVSYSPVTAVKHHACVRRNVSTENFGNDQKQNYSGEFSGGFRVGDRLLNCFLPI